MKKLFGTDGIRGLANRHPMTPEIALALGEAISFYFARKKGGGRIVVGKDTRRSSYMFELALSAGISSMGSVAILTGPLPTPGIAFITNAMRADAGVMISASHNSFQDNGIKFFDREGFKLDDEIEYQMEEFIFAPQDEHMKPSGDAIGRAIRIEDAAGRYAEFLKSSFPKELSLDGIKIALDCAHGAAYNVAPLVLREMGAQVVTTGDKPNGTNINDNCGALHPEHIAELVKKEGAQIGIALDGDADRLILSDEKGNVVDGDKILAVCGFDRLQQNCLKKNIVVGTVMSNMGLEVFLKEHGIQLLRTQVGDRKIMEVIKKEGYCLGGEPSGHIIFSELSTTGDGMLAALQVLSILIRTQKTLSELASVMPVFPQKTKNIKVREKKNLDAIEPLQAQMNQINQELKDKGRIVLRYSGTEPLLRLMVEAEDENLVDRHITRLEECIHNYV